MPVPPEATTPETRDDARLETAALEGEAALRWTARAATASVSHPEAPSSEETVRFGGPLLASLFGPSR